MLVTGAGFTRAFVADAPLMVDDFGAESLAAKVKRMPHASQVLDWERVQNPQGFINLERLMTRLDSLMPYDEDRGATDEYRFLLAALTEGFLDRLTHVTARSNPRPELNNVARFCVDNRVDCITFNYDDVLDRALAKTRRKEGGSWHESSGYGFYCATSRTTLGVQWDTHLTREPPMLVLKLHGSINWRPRKGALEPYMLDEITYHGVSSEENVGAESDIELMERHLEHKPVIAPPVLSKASLVRQPVLRLVWSRAYEALTQARSVTFVGYSFPTTDIAAQTLFAESLRDLRPSAIRVINLATDKKEQERIVQRYRSVLGDVPDRQFDFRGALEWSRNLDAWGSSLRRKG